VPRPVYQDVLVDQDWGRNPPDPRQVTSTMRDRVEHALQISDVVSNPLFLAFWRASVPIISCLTSSRFRGGGLGVHKSSVLFLGLVFIFVVFY